MVLLFTVRVALPKETPVLWMPPPLAGAVLPLMVLLLTVRVALPNNPPVL